MVYIYTFETLQQQNFTLLPPETAWRLPASHYYYYTDRA